MINRILTFSLITAIATGCAIQRKPSKLEYLQKDWDGKSASWQIEYDVTRASTPYAPIDVKATLYTRAYIEALEMETGPKRLRPSNEIKKEVDRQIQSYVSKTSCFHFTVKGKDPEAALLKNYTAYVRDEDANVTPVQFLPEFESTSAPLKITESTGSYYIKSGIGCTTKRPINTSKAFALYLTDNVSKKVTLSWDPPVIE